MLQSTLLLIFNTKGCWERATNNAEFMRPMGEVVFEFWEIIRKTIVPIFYFPLNEKHTSMRVHTVKTLTFFNLYFDCFTYQQYIHQMLV